MQWTAPEISRTPEPSLGDEHAVLNGWLDYHRDTLLHKCAGLTSEQLTMASIEPSNLTLLGLVRHMTELERWFRGVLTDETLEDPYYTDSRPDAAFDDVAAASAEADLELFRTEIDLARKATPVHGLDDTHEDEDGVMSIRSLVIHLIEEYARHNGHADLIRQRIDGATGT